MTYGETCPHHLVQDTALRHTGAMSPNTAANETHQTTHRLVAILMNIDVSGKGTVSLWRGTRGRGISERGK